MPESVADNVVGTAITTVALALVFRYVFGDSWTVALAIALVWAPVAFVIVEVLRRRRARG